MDVLSEDVGKQMHAQIGERRGGQAAGGDVETRPGQHRRGNEDDIEIAAGDGRFRARFDGIGQFVVDGIATAEGLIERVFERILVIVRQRRVDGRRKAIFPVAVFDLTAGLGQATRQSQ